MAIDPSPLHELEPEFRERFVSFVTERHLATLTTVRRDGSPHVVAVGFSYEGLAWFTGAAAMLAGFPNAAILALAVLYSLGAHGTMTLNDFKAVDGDRRMGVKSLPVQLGVDAAVRLACLVMALPQVAVIVLLLAWDRPYHAIAIVLLLAVQMALMPSLIDNPRDRAPWYNATGTSLYAIGMLVSAFAVRGVSELWP